MFITAIFEAGTEHKALTMKSKISSMTTIETHPFWPYSYILWKVVYRNTRYMCIIRVANIIWRSGHAIRSSFPLDFSSLHYSCRRVFTVFYVTAYNRFGRALFGDIFGRQIVLSMHKKVDKENSPGAKVDYF